jgi:hypothetical protein
MLRSSAFLALLLSGRSAIDGPKAGRAKIQDVLAMWGDYTLEYRRLVTRVGMLEWPRQVVSVA